MPGLHVQMMTNCLRAFCLVMSSSETWVNLDGADESYGTACSVGTDHVGNMPRVRVHLLDELAVDVVAAM